MTTPTAPGRIVVDPATFRQLGDLLDAAAEALGRLNTQADTTAAMAAVSGTRTSLALYDLGRELRSTFNECRQGAALIDALLQGTLAQHQTTDTSLGTWLGGTMRTLQSLLPGAQP